MEVNAILMNKIAVKAEGGGYAAKSSASDQNFNSFMEKAVDKNNKNVQNKNYANRADKKQPDKKVHSTSAKNEAVEKERVDGDNKTDTTKSNETDAATNQKVDKTDSSQKQQPKDLEQLNEEVISELSQALSIPAEVISQILAEMNMTALELSDSNELKAFIENLVSHDDSIVLLNVSDIGRVTEDVQEVLSQFEEMSVEETMAKETMVGEAVVEEATQEKTAVFRDVLEETTDKTPILTEMESILDEPIEEQPVLSDANEQEAANQDTGHKDNTLKRTETPEATKEDSKIRPKDEDHTNDFQNVDAVVTGLNEVRHIHNVNVKAEAVSNVDTQEVINQILEKMKVEIKGDVSEVRLTLRPEHLGDVSLKISTENGIVTASFTAENQRVKEVIESNLTQLKDALAEQGIQISQLSVSVGQNDQQRRMGEFSRGQQASSRIARISNARTETAMIASHEENYSNPYDILENSVDFTA